MQMDDSRWLDGWGVYMLRDIGVRAGDRLLDFGCGTGFYVLPAAEVVGSGGVVYALDRNHDRLETLAVRAGRRGLSNVEIVETAGSLALPFDNGVVDVVLVYDVIHSDFFSDGKRQRLLRETRRVLTPDGFLSIFPSHMDDDAAIETAKQAGFTLDRRITTRLHHYHDVVTDTVLNFKKREP